MELVDPLTLFNHITQQVRFKILDLFTWKAGTWTFFRGVVCEKRAFPLASSAPDLLHDGIRGSLTADELESWWRSSEKLRLAPAELPEPPPDWWPLLEPERTVLVTVDRILGAGDVLRRAITRAPHLPRDELVRALHFALTVGLLRTAD
jgi:hypothetical protein